MKKQHLVFPLLVAVLLLSGCLARSERTDKPGPDWSRALHLGSANTRQPVALQVDERGGVHLAWLDVDLRYAHLDEQGQVIYNDVLAIDLPNPRAPQLQVDGQDNVHLGWMSRRENRQQIYHAVIAPDATVQDVTPVSPTGADVEGFSMYLSPAGEIRFLWSGDTPDGASGMVDTGLGDAQSRVMVTGAIDPYVVVDQVGTVHVVWLQPRGLYARAIYYATLEREEAGSKLVPEGGQQLAGFEFGEGAVYYPPVIGLDGDDVYVLWSQQGVGGGLTPTSAFTRYVHFPRGQPQRTSSRPILLPGESRPEYDPYGTAFGLTQLDLLTGDETVYGTDFVNAPATIAGGGAALPVAVSVKAESEAESRIQLATVLFRSGEAVGYQLASDTRGASLIPSLAADDAESLHLAWIDTAGFGQYDVYYASLAPAARAWLDRTTSDDIMRRGADILFGVFSGVGLLPIAGIWTFPAMLWVVIFFIASGQEEMDRRPAQIGFAVAVVVYAAVKVILMPGLFAATPFLYQFPRSLAVAVGIAVPLLILLIALAVVYVYLRRSERPTIFKAFLLFALVDVVLTLVLYAPGFFGPA